MGGSTGSDESSDEEDATWKAAIQSIASTTTFGSQVSGASSLSNGSAKSLASQNGDYEDAEKPRDPQKLKHYQIKKTLEIHGNGRPIVAHAACREASAGVSARAQKMLEQMLEKSIDIVDGHVKVPDVKPVSNEGGVRLFKNSPVGILFDSKDDIQRPTKKPRLVPPLAIEKNSKKFRQEVKSITVDGAAIMAAAKNSAERSLARLAAKEAAAKEKAKKEEERVAELKKIRGEKWLPSVAKEMQPNGNLLKR